jgi:transposase-like protein
VDMGQFSVEKHLRTGRPVKELARTHGVSASWLLKLLRRYRLEGGAGLVARSRRPAHSPSRIADLYEDEIVALRKELDDLGVDAGAETIHYHLSQRCRHAPSVSTIYRVLKVRGFVTPEPRKRPRSSYIRFCADLPNEWWQADMTHVCSKRSGLRGAQRDRRPLGTLHHLAGHDPRQGHRRDPRPAPSGRAMRLSGRLF